uniref:helix-turn-helix domain-containing protein n=1 Tax=Enterococcus casseliflavus TaxID=37734 RepID=UPI001C931630
GRNSGINSANKEGASVMNIEKINMILEERNITAYALAKSVGIPTSHMTKILSGKVNDPRFNLVCRFADALNISIEELRKDDIDG